METQKEKEIFQSEVTERIAEEIKNKTGSLDLSWMGLKFIPEEIRMMNWLMKIDISANDLKKIENLPANLIWLDISANDLKKIENLPASLIQLNISRNQIKKIENLPASLTWLDMAFNKMVDLKMSWDQILRSKLQVISKWQGNLVKEGELNLYDNPLENPPKEVLEQGHQAIVVYMDQYLAEQSKADFLFESKLLIIGESGAGKTTFARRLKDKNAELPNRNETTHGINVDKWNFEIKSGEFVEIDQRNARFFVNIWDFGGQDIYHGTHQFFFSEKSLYVLLADTREEKADFGYWLNTVEQLSGDNSSLFILLNKRDGRIWQIDENGLRSRFGKILKETKTVDLSDSDAIPNLQEQIRYWLKQLPEVGVPLIDSWVRIREDLAEETNNVISLDRFREICRKWGVHKAEYIRNISKYFHRIGVITHYLDDQLLNNKVYLNSNWLTDTVYRILDSSVAIENKGRLNIAQIRSIWSDETLEFETQTLLRLLDKFGLMYRTPVDNYIIPRHLPDQQPYERWPFFKDRSLLHFRYTFDKYMPKGLMSRLIVALHTFILDHDLVWKRGVNLTYNGSHAEIVEQYGGINQFDIRIAGIFNRDLLVIITQTFDRILQKYRKLNHEKKIKCPCQGCAQSYDPYFHSTSDIEKALVKKYRKSNPTVECKESFEDVPIKQLIALIDYESVITNLRHLAPKDGHGEILTAIANLGVKVDIGFERTLHELAHLPCKVKAEFEPDLRVILDLLQTVDFNTAQTEDELTRMQELIQSTLTEMPSALSLQKDWKMAQQKAANLDLKSKLELTIPFIPGILSYKTEFATDFKGSYREKLLEMWNDLRRGQAFWKDS